MLIKLFTTTSCHKCPAAKSWMQQHEIEYEPVIVDQHSEGMILATMYEVSSVPSIVIIDDIIGHKTLLFEDFKMFYNGIKDHSKLLESIGRL